MNGVEIVRHSLQMLLRNLGPALRVSVGPFLIALAIAMLLTALGLGAGLGLDPDASPELGVGLGLILGVLLTALVFLFAFSWVAVAWHRYILKEESPGLLPPLRPELVWPYLGRSIQIALLLILVAIPLALVLGLVAGASQSVLVAAITGLVVSLVLGWLGTRLSLVLPARAVDRPMSLGESWAVTAPASGPIFVVVLVLALLNVVLSLLFSSVLGESLLSALLSLVVQWFTTMLGLSVLTTLYGHLVERRPLAV